jgi:hypothetical protein
MHMFRTFAAAFLITGFVACNKVPTVQAQSPDSYPAYDNLAPAPDDASQTPWADDDQYAPPDDGEAIETSEAPPPLPEYDQPPAPGPDYYWTPGYWAWGPAGYYWVPGDWVEAPWIGAVWTPPYWAFSNGYYLFHAGYWGPYVGFYGGINYGFGYPGRGYYGAYWNGGHLFYNSAVTHVNRNVIHNVYRRDVPRFHSGRASFNGGHGGIDMRPTQREQAVIHERRAPAQAAQRRNAQQARQEHNRTNFAARPAPQAPQANPRQPRVRGEQRPAPQRNEFHPAPHPAPISPQGAQQRPAPRANPQPQQQRQRMNRRPDLQNHLELQQQRPAAPHTPAPAPHSPAPAPHVAPPAPHATPAPAAPQRGNRGERGNGGERGRGGR